MPFRSKQVNLVDDAVVDALIELAMCVDTVTHRFSGAAAAGGAASEAGPNGALRSGQVIADLGVVREVLLEPALWSGASTGARRHWLLRLLKLLSEDSSGAA